MATAVRPKTKLREVNRHIVCRLCLGYYVDATTITECLHSFCRSCIIKYLEKNSFCPICEVQIHNAKPYRNLRLDKALQDIVYKLVPGLYHNEMERRARFYANHPEQVPLTSPEQRGQVERLIFSPEDMICFSTEYLDRDDECNVESSSSHSSENGDPGMDPTFPQQLGLMKLKKQDTRRDSLDSVNSQPPQKYPKTYFKCAAVVNLAIIKKLIRQKYDLPPSCQVDLIHKKVPLPDHYTLMDVAYIYTWKRNGPIRFLYQIYEIRKHLKPPVLRPIEHTPSETPKTKEKPKPKTPLPNTREQAKGDILNQSKLGQSAVKTDDGVVTKIETPGSSSLTQMKSAPSLAVGRKESPSSVKRETPVSLGKKDSPSVTLVKKETPTSGKKESKSPLEKIKSPSAMLAKSMGVVESPTMSYPKKESPSANLVKKEPLPMNTTKKESSPLVKKESTTLAAAKRDLLASVLPKKGAAAVAPVKNYNAQNTEAKKNPVVVMTQLAEKSSKDLFLSKKEEATQKSTSAELKSQSQVKQDVSPKTTLIVPKPSDSMFKAEPQTPKKTEILTLKKEPSSSLTIQPAESPLKITKDSQTPKKGGVDAKKEFSGLGKLDEKSNVSLLKNYRKGKSLTKHQVKNGNSLTITTPAKREKVSDKHQASVSIEIKSDKSSEYDFDSGSPPNKVMSLQEYTKSELYKSKFPDTPNGWMSLPDFRKQLKENGGSKEDGKKEKPKTVPSLYRIGGAGETKKQATTKSEEIKQSSPTIININTNTDTGSIEDKLKKSTDEVSTEPNKKPEGKTKMVSGETTKKKDKLTTAETSESEILKFLLKRKKVEKAASEIRSKVPKLSQPKEGQGVMDLSKGETSPKSGKNPLESLMDMAKKTEDKTNQHDMLEMLVSIAQAHGEQGLKVPQMPGADASQAKSLTNADIMQALQFYKKLNSDMKSLEAKSHLQSPPSQIPADSKAQQPVPASPASVQQIQQFYQQQIDIIRMVKRQQQCAGGLWGSPAKQPKLSPSEKQSPNSGTSPKRVSPAAFSPSTQDLQLNSTMERTLCQIQEQAETQTKLLAEHARKNAHHHLHMLYSQPGLFPPTKHTPAMPKVSNQTQKTPSSSSHDAQQQALNAQLFNAGLTSEMSFHQMFQQYLDKQLTMNLRKPPPPPLKRNRVSPPGAATPPRDSPGVHKLPVAVLPQKTSS